MSCSVITSKLFQPRQLHPRFSSSCKLANFHTFSNCHFSLFENPKMRSIMPKIPMINLVNNPMYYIVTLTCLSFVCDYRILNTTRSQIINVGEFKRAGHYCNSNEDYDRGHMYDISECIAVQRHREKVIHVGQIIPRCG